MNFLQKFEEKYGKNYPNELRMVYDFTHEKDEDDDGNITHYNYINIVIEEKTAEGWKRLFFDIPEIDLSRAAALSQYDYNCSCDTLLGYLENISLFVDVTSSYPLQIVFFKLIDMHKDKFLGPLIQNEIDRLLKEIESRQALLNELYDKKYNKEGTIEIFDNQEYRAKLQRKMDNLKDGIEKQTKDLQEYTVGYPQYNRRFENIKKLKDDLKIITEAYTSH